MKGLIISSKPASLQATEGSNVIFLEERSMIPTIFLSYLFYSKKIKRHKLIDYQTNNKLAYVYSDFFQTPTSIITQPYNLELRIELNRINFVSQIFMW